MANSNGEERTHSSNPAASPPIDFQINDQLSRDEHLELAWAKNIIGFCQECAYFCQRKGVKIGGCAGFKCICSNIKID